MLRAFQHPVSTRAMNDLRVPLLRRLENFPPLFVAAIQGVTEDEARWQPDPGAWSIVQILGHMVDEECDDFRPRLLSTITDPEATWPAIDPEGYVVARDHQNAPVAELLQTWQAERRASVEALHALGEVNWDQSYAHPQLGPLRAGDLLLSWVNHDHLHLRQVAQRLYQLANRDGAPFRCDYAGPW